MARAFYRLIDMSERLLLVTGHLAYPRLERLMRSLGETPFAWEIYNIGVKVAALMTESILLRRLPRPLNADRILLPGRFRGDIERLANELGVPVARGPDEISDLPIFLGRGARAPDLSRYDIRIFAEIVDAAGAPGGVFNLVNGTGPDVGQAMAGHPDVDMVSFTGSTRAGIIVAKTAADTVKRVAQELGGKSPNIILRDADFEAAVRAGVAACFSNSGQSCDAPTRMLAPAERFEDALRIAAEVADDMKVGDPREPGVDLGPVVSRTQFDKIQRLIETAVREGSRLVAGGPGRPPGLNRGYYVRPTVFGATPGMAIEREEVFGPVLTVMAYEDEDEAVRIANDTVYGLAAYVSSSNIDHARAIAARLRAGTVNLNYPAWDIHAPFGGFKQSGNGREYADFGIDDYLELKAIVGYGD